MSFMVSLLLNLTEDITVGVGRVTAGWSQKNAKKKLVLAGYRSVRGSEIWQSTGHCTDVVACSSVSRLFV